MKGAGMRAGLLLVLLLPAAMLPAGEPGRKQAVRQILDLAAESADPHFYWQLSFSGDACRLDLRRDDREGGNRLHARLSLREVRAHWPARGPLQLQCRSHRCIGYRQLLGREVVEGELAHIELPPLRPDAELGFGHAVQTLIELCRDPFGPR